MPSPIAHAVTGYCLGQVWANLYCQKPVTRPQKRLFTTVGLLSAIAADLDFLPQLFADVSFHRGVSHSLGIGLGFCLLLALICRRSSRTYFEIAALGFLGYASHLLMDLLTKGGRGTPIFWPLSSQTIQIPFDIFPQVHHSEGLFYGGHIPVVIFEVTYALLMVWLTQTAINYCYRRNFFRKPKSFSVEEVTIAVNNRQ